MESQLYAILAPVRRRLDTQRVLKHTARGLLAGAAIAVVVAPLRWWLPFGVVAGLLIAAVVLGEVVGLWLAMLRKHDWHAAAAAVDACYKLQDRTITALAFLAKTPRSPIEERQVAEALGRLEQVDPRQVVRSWFPREFLGAAGLILLAAAVVTWPVRPTTTAAGPEPGRVAGKPEPAKRSAPVQEPSEVKPPGPKPAPDPAATERLRAAVRWQPAPGGSAPLGTATAPAGPGLRELASQVAGEAEASDTDAGAKPQAAVLEDEPLPLRYRQAIRRYFTSIRPAASAPR